MSRLKLCFLLAVICSCSQYGVANPTTPKTVIIPVEHPLETEEVPEAVIPETTPAPAPPSDSTSTPEPKPVPSTKTTPESTNTTTSASTTTTTSESTTTTAPASTTTTTASTTTTTTLKPKPAPTPAPAPGPLPPPDQGTWFFTDRKTNVTCIVAQFAAQLNVTYTKVVDSATSLWYVLLNVPANATVVDGNCTAADQWIQVSWLSSNTSTLANNMTLVYHRNETTKNYGLKSLNVSLSPENFVNSSSKDPMELYHGTEWQTPLATSYRCKTATLLNMTSESASAVAVLTLSRLQEEAYRTTNGSGFSAARECGGADVPDAVPIAVGCALGGLVLVVLVAYLVGRRRSAARGYLSM